MNTGEIWERLQFAEPEWLWLLTLVPVMAYCRVRFKKGKASLLFPSLDNVRMANPRKPWANRLALPALRLLAFVSFVLALGRPQFDESTFSVQESGVDIVLAVDLSASMLALDMSEPNGEIVTRLDVVKRVIKDFVTKRKHDRIGLVGFSVNPYLLSPLTLDKEHLQRNMERLRVGLTHQTGTNIGGALAEGINRVRQLDAETRLVILLTDGKDEPAPRHSPLVFAEGAKGEGIKVYTIAVGRSTRTRTYVFDPSNRDLLRHPDGSPVIQVHDYPVDKEVLSKIAETTEAQFFEAGDETALRTIYDEIDQLEKTEIEYDVNALYEELFHWPLIAGLGLLLVEIALSRTLLLRIP